MNAVFLDIISRTLDVVGKVLVAYMAIRVHHRVWQDHKIDKQVFLDMKEEQFFGYLGIAFMLAAYFIKMFEILIL